MLTTRRLEVPELLLAVGMTSGAISRRTRRSDVVQYLTRLTGIPIDEARQHGLRVYVHRTDGR